MPVFIIPTLGCYCQVSAAPKKRPREKTNPETVTPKTAKEMAEEFMPDLLKGSWCCQRPINKVEYGKIWKGFISRTS